MYENNFAPQRPAVNRIRYLLLAAAVVTFLLMVMGSVVRVSNAAQACPDWPTCYGQLGFPAGLSAQLQVTHRGLAAGAALLTWAATVWAFARYRVLRWLSRPLAAASVLMAVEVLMGAGLIGANPAAWRAPLHLGIAMMVLGLVVISATSSFILHRSPAQPDRLAFHSPFARLSWGVLAAIFLLMLSGSVVTASDAGQACAGWPLCGGGLPQTGLGWLAFTHRLITLAVSGLIAWMFVRAWRTQRSQVILLPAATSVFILLVGQVLLGALKVQRGFPADLVWLHAASSASLWAAQVLLVTAAGLAARSAQEEALEGEEALPVRRRFKDFVILSKPIIVLLLLVTTYAGMVVGAHKLPSLSLTFWTMVGGALAAGGASALNQYIDRETDKAMQRTAKRPLPDGRFKPPEGLAYGLGACLLSFFLMAGYVNLLAALLSLAGMVYYVLLYSIWLKHATVQNIVIGGGAGAIPPLVGWAAATGSLNFPSLFLFAIVFLWTPPHFWSLALVRRSDYARGKVPMLPVIRGEAETRKQVFIYTLELVALTLLMPLLRIAGSVYLISAVVLGAWLIHTAWRVLKSEGNKTAWLMYRYSSMYLAFLFLALVVDALV